MKYIRKYQKALLVLVVVILYIGYYLLNRSDFAQLSHINKGDLLLVGLGYLVIVITNGLFIKLVVRPFKVQLSAYESIRVSLISSLGNFFASSGAGLGFRAVYLKKRHGLGYQQYITTLYGNYLLTFIINAIAGLVSLLLAPQKGGTVYWLAIAFFAVLACSSAVLCFVPIRATHRKGILGKVANVLHQMTSGWKVLARDYRLLAGLTGLVVLQLAITMLILRAEVAALGMSVGISGLLFLSVLGALSVFISVTPANIGVKEGVYLLTASIVGLTTVQVLSIALIDRGVLFITLGLLWLVVGKSRTEGKGSNA